MKEPVKKSILIDLDRLKDLNTGLGQVALFFGEELGKHVFDDIEITYLVPRNFKGRFGNNVKYESTSYLRRYFPFLCRRYDLWYTIHQDSWFFPSSRKTPYIITINDLNFLGEKSPRKAKSRLQRLQKKVDRASLITTISQNSEMLIRQNLELRDKPVKVIYCGVKVPECENPPKPDYVPEGDLLFSVGVVQPKKNYEVLIGFMARMPENYKLIIAGNKSGEHSAELERKIRLAGLENRILLPGLISDEDKCWLYRHCKAVLFPSRLEGMGFPPVEAMRYGKPVFASTFSSIPEVSEDKAYYWVNFDPTEMAAFFLEKIAEYEADPALPEILRKHSLKFTWEHATAEYIDLFKKWLPK
ncbi:MAG: glycosyltransferase family 4 protein [Bacteroidetes bacterium]|nr:glycosyltransferase family 4 protein [Bacteroidota bacterium]